MRHEAGHCFDHAYKVSRGKEWKRIFGNPRKKYDPDNYVYDTSSQDFVINLDEHYAQAHPDEDFAETFAIWLEMTKEKWLFEYSNWKIALEKLLYVDEL